MKCAIVDDEPLARQLLATYVGEHPALELVGSGRDAFEALELLRTTPVELMFLDIQMPKLTGLEFLRSLPSPPRVIFTTAHGEHAVDAFELAAADYLLKPISRERFLRAVGRVLEPAPATPPPATSTEGGTAARVAEAIFVRVDQQLVRLELDQIVAVEAYENYVKFHTPQRTYLTKRSISEIEEMLPAERFLRVHRSYVVNLAHIRRIEGNLLSVGGREIPVSRTLRGTLLNRLQIA